MKLSLTTTISVASIVAAGAAAYAINVNVLEAPAATNPVAAAVSTPTTLATPANGQTSAMSAQTPVAVQAVSVSGQTSKYDVEGAGSVLINETDKGLSVASISPGAGWTSEPARVLPDGAVSVHFVSGTQRLEFVARKVNGKIAAVVTNESSVDNGAPVANTPGATIPGGTMPGSAPAVGTKPQIPSNLGGDEDDDPDDDHEEEDDHHDDRHEDDDDD